MKYVTLEQILLIHSIVIDETGGMHGVRDHHAILSFLQAPQQIVFGRELYPTIFLKAAVYVRDIIMHHAFLDGNKRTGMTVAVVFLENNGYDFTAREGEIEKFALKTVEKKLTIEKIALWLRKHSKKHSVVP